jgi:hypothetical protein
MVENDGSQTLGVLRSRLDLAVLIDVLRKPLSLSRGIYIDNRNTRALKIHQH